MRVAEIYGQPAFILQQRPFKETSLLLTVFTRDYGVITLLAKGVRKSKSRLIGVLLPFAQLNISYLDKNELKVLTQAEYIERYDLQRLALYCGFYVNELIQRLLHPHDPHPELFSIYQHCLQNLLQPALIENGLRYFELDLLNIIGYGMQLDVDSSNDLPICETQRYRFAVNLGLVQDNRGIVSGRTLNALNARSVMDTLALSEAKLLLRQMMEPYLRGKPLKSRQVLASILSHL